MNQADPKILAEVHEKLGAFVGNLHLAAYGVMQGMPQGYGMAPLMAMATCIGDLASLIYPEDAESAVADLVQALKAQASANGMMTTEARQARVLSYHEGFRGMREREIAKGKPKIVTKSDAAINRAAQRWSQQ